MDPHVNQQEKGQSSNKNQAELGNVMKQTTKVQGAGGCPLFVRKWLPKGDVKACLHILHGMAEHSKRYDDFATYMAEAGYLVWVHDHRQHGYSVLHHKFGIYDGADTWEAMLEDVGLVQEAFQRQYPTVPMMMLGHSMGSLLLRSYLQDKKTNVKKAVVMGSPVSEMALVKMAVTMSKIIGQVGYYHPSQLMNTLSVGKFNKGISEPRTAFDWISHDPEIVASYVDDPMCGYTYNAAFYKELSRGMLDANNQANMCQFPKIPALFISGLEDPCGRLGEGVKQLVTSYQQKGVRVTSKLMGHMRHEVLNEYNKKETYKQILKFLDE